MESDQYMPEYWPANRIIGKLEKALVKAENILGLIQSEQIANLAAAKVTGLLTSAQIKEIEAAKIAGQLTNAQLKEIEAAKITGEITSAQIKNLEANKLLGKLTNSQIESIEAAKLTGQITETQIGPESVTTEKLKAANVTTAKLAAGAITAEKIAAASITAEKLAAESVEAAAIKALTITAGKIAANAITSEKINALAVTAAKIAAEAITTEKLAANSVTAAKIVAGTITAEKLSVATLSAISASLGTITSGRLEAVELVAATGSFKGRVDLKAAEVALPGIENQIRWLNSESLTTVSFWARSTEKNKNKLLILTVDTAEANPAYFQAVANTEKLEAAIRTSHSGFICEETAEKKLPKARVLIVKKEGVSIERLVLDENENSQFVQLPASAKRKLTRGISKVVWPGGVSTKDIEIEHGLGEAPTMVVATNTSPTLGLWQITVDTGAFTATKFTARSTFNTGFSPGAGSETFVSWIAMT